MASRAEIPIRASVNDRNRTPETTHQGLAHSPAESPGGVARAARVRTERRLSRGLSPRFGTLSRTSSGSCRDAPDNADGRAVGVRRDDPI